MLSEPALGLRHLPGGTSERSQMLLTVSLPLAPRPRRLGGSSWVGISFVAIHIRSGYTCRVLLRYRTIAGGRVLRRGRQRKARCDMNRAADRRTFLKGSALIAVAEVLGVSALTGCSGRSHVAGMLSDTVRFGFLADMQVPDPDIFYEGEGLQVTLSAYEGLVAYQPDSADIGPALADSWTITDDGLTYTFTLRAGVTFHDGTPMTATAIIASYERRSAVNQAPAYLVADVASMSAPDDSTLVIELSHPVEPFLDYLACPWGLKAVSPTAVQAHSVNGDLAQGWLSTHDAGTGPYRITEFVPSSHYTLTAYDGYWGTKPEFTTLRIEIIPDITTQRLLLEQGQLDIITKGLPIAAVEAMKANPALTVVERPTAFKSSIFLNWKKGAFADTAFRQAMRKAVDVPALIGPAYGSTVARSTQFYPAGVLPDGAAPDAPGHDPSDLKALIAKLPENDKQIDLVYDEAGGATDARVTELLQTQLAALGLTATVRAMPTSQVFALHSTPVGQQPHMLVHGSGGDALNADTTLRIFFRTGVAPINWFNYSNTALDAVMDAGKRSLNTAEAERHWVEGAEIVMEQAWVINLCDIEDVIVTDSGIGHIVHTLLGTGMVPVNLLRKVTAR
ncbi:ABC transporter substrate-binding protein [Nocardia cyriacigeorgica]|uniref:ABC transporter substrate-binding protein n=1 Tax=Nocardia cyriacigeorgica TaxID=135487 RepID=UPI001893F782|nr:ABC transporter substrate-binding protein [Nocardia cyriacigeorgica]MBF6416331.1 ABC transporter substrate-binding protein [Nocardia cyriacigeorgica]